MNARPLAADDSYGRPRSKILISAIANFDSCEWHCGNPDQIFCSTFTVFPFSFPLPFSFLAPFKVPGVRDLSPLILPSRSILKEGKPELKGERKYKEINHKCRVNDPILERKLTAEKKVGIKTELIILKLRKMALKSAYLKEVLFLLGVKLQGLRELRVIVVVVVMLCFYLPGHVTTTFAKPVL